MMAMLEVAHGTKPMNNITAAAGIRPAGRNTPAGWNGRRPNP